MSGRYAVIFLVAYGGVVAASDANLPASATENLSVNSTAPLNIVSDTAWSSFGNSTKLPADAVIAPYNSSAFSMTPQQGYTIWANGTVGPAPRVSDTANTTSSALPAGTGTASRRWTHPEVAFHGYGSAKF